MRPILVTGSHRSGTTWVGRLLCLSGEAHGVHEPFNPAFERSWLRQPPPTWFHHVSADADQTMAGQLEAIVSLRPPLRQIAARSRRARHLGATALEGARAAAARRAHRRVVLKDPIAFFSAEWLCDRFDTMNVVLVRHPAAFASSLKRLRWSFDFSNLTHQPALMSGPIAPFAREVHAAAAHGGQDLIGEAILLWRIINSTAALYRERHPAWSVLRYEDLATDPVGGLERLYGHLGLSWSTAVAAGVERFSGSQNGSVVPETDKGGIRRDSSAAMWTWLDRLTLEEIARVRQGTEDVARAFYSSEDWRAPLRR